ncbi:unnamed protein product [Dibothriocephalus latus]|uniref:Uncharacterized protein n=1 Tax=Dibothriocephalus latus TaxID=60516 RepID=A0A3P7MMZ2_DIBLA|nr:unnamed protein product [Dibothriocephalus latus]
MLAAWKTYLDWAVGNCSQKATKSVVQKRSTTAADAAPPPPLTPFEVICLFERAITALCLHPSVWLKAADFLVSHFRIVLPSPQCQTCQYFVKTNFSDGIPVLLGGERTGCLLGLKS